MQYHLGTSVQFPLSLGILLAVKTFALIAALLFQARPVTPLAAVRSTLQQLKDHLADHRPTFGATPELTAAKHTLRDWTEMQLAEQGKDVDVVAFAEKLRAGLRDVDMFCADCDSVNYLGYLDDIRVNRHGAFLIIITATGISCGFDESAYIYAWTGRQWQRVWDHEQNTYTPGGYLPQQIHDIQISPADAAGKQLLLLFGSQTLCGGAFKNLYARAWSITTANEFKPVLNWTGFGNDGYPPLTGRTLAGDVLFEYTAGGLISGQAHTAIRHFKIEGDAPVQVDPIAGRPHDFVLEWLAAPWSESRSRSVSASLEPLHDQLRREDAAGDTPESTLRCTGGADLWQVATALYERPKRYYRVRWEKPFTFTMIGISETPYPDCTARDEAGETYPDILSNSH